jgi:hypothetical protein
MTTSLAYGGVNKKILAAIAISVGVLLVALIGIRYAAAVAPSDYGLKEGDTISAAGSDDPDVYIVNDWGYKRLFLNPAIFGFYGHLGGFAKVKSVTPATRDAFGTSGLFRNCETNDPKVYGVEVTGEDTGNLHWVNVTGAQAVADDPNFFKKVFCINTNEFNWYPKSTDYTSVSQVPSYARAGATPTPTPGALSVSLAPGNPGASTVTLNAQGVEFLRARFSGSGTVTSVTLKRTGAGATADFADVYVYDGARRLVSGKTFSSSSGEVTFSNLSVAVSGTKDLSFVGDMAGSGTALAGDVDGIQLVSVSASGTVSGTPISGNLMTLAGASSGTITLAKVGSIGSPNVGQSNAHLSEFKLTANTEAASVKRIQMIQGGTVTPAGLTNLVLKTGSNQWSGTIDSAGYIVFDLGSGYSIAKGGNAIFDVYGDVAGKKDETIKLYFEYSTDILAVGDQYGYGMAATITAMDAAAAAFDLKLTGGVLTISFVGPTAADIGTTTDNTTFLQFNMSAATDIEIRKTRVLIATDSGGNGTWDTFSTASTSIADLDDIKIINTDTGAILAGPVDGSSFTSTAYGNNPSGTAAAGYQYTDVIDMTGGQTIHAAITADVKTANDRTGQDLAGNDKVAIGLANYANSSYLGVTYLKYAGTNTALAATDVVPNANVWGPAMTVVTSALTLGLSANPASQTAIQGTSNVDAVGITFTAANSSDLKVTDITVTGYTAAHGSDTFANHSGAIATMVSSVALYEKESGALISSTPNTNSLGNTTASTVVFNNLSWTIPAGSTKTLLVRANLLNLAPGSYPYFSFDIADPATDVTAIDSSSNTVNPSATTGPNTTTPSVLVTYSSAGSIYVTEYESSPSLTKHSVYWGQTGVTLAQFKVRTVNEGFYITRFNLKSGDNATSTAAVKANIKNVYLSYLDKNGNTVTTSGQPLNADTLPSTSFGFSGDARPYIPADTSRVISVKVDTNGTYAQGATSGVKVALDFSGGAADEFQAVGEGSQATKTGTSVTDIPATNPVYVYRSFPKIAAVSMPNGATSGQVVVGKFDITAMGYDVLFGKTDAASGTLKFDSLSSGSIGTSSPSFTLYDDAANTALTAATTINANTKNASVSFTTFTTAFSIPANTTKRIRVTGDLSRFLTPVNTTSGLGADYFQLILQDESNVIKWVDSHGADANGDAANVAGYLETLPAYGPWLTGQ